MATPDDPSSISGRLRKLGYPPTAKYADYLAGEHWRKVRARWHAEHPNARCECGARGTALHHKTYVRLGRERLSDLELVCDACHRKRHGIKAKRKRRATAKPGSKGITHRRIPPDPRPREWSFDRDLRGQFAAPPFRATTRDKRRA